MSIGSFVMASSRSSLDMAFLDYIIILLYCYSDVYDDDNKRQCEQPELLNRGGRENFQPFVFQQSFVRQHIATILVEELLFKTQRLGGSQKRQSMNHKGEETSRARVKIEKKFRRHLHVTIVKYILSLFGQTLSLFGQTICPGLRTLWLRRLWGAPTFPPDEEKSIFVGRLRRAGYRTT